MTKNYVNSCLRWLANELVPYYISKQLPKSMMEKFDRFYMSVSRGIDWENFTKDQLLSLGFLNWEETSDAEGIWFIPNWLSPIIPEGLQVKNTKGETFSYSAAEAPKEVLYGCLTFGVTLLSANEGDY